MKKLMIAAFAMALGFAASAATVDWQYEITAASKTKNAYDGYTVYLVDAAKWDAALKTGITAGVFADDKVVMDSTTFSEGSGKTTYKYSTLNSAGAANLRAVEIKDLAKGDSRNFYYIALNTNESPSQWQNIASATLTGRDSDETSDPTGYASGTQAAFNGGTWTDVKKGGDPEPTPEPTTGLLMLAGLAGLALRRKQK